MDIWDIALGFMNSQILFAAEKMGVFEMLARGPRSAREVAAAARIPEDSAARLLTALCALGVVIRNPAGAYENSMEAAQKLVRGGAGYIGGMFHHLREHLYPTWRFLPEALAEQSAQWERAFPEQPRINDEMHHDHAALRAFMEGMHGITYCAAAEFATYAPELRDVRTLVDVGGASGAFAIAVAERHPQLHATVYDLERVGPIAREFIAAAGLDGRVSFQTGNFWDDDIPAGADAYSLGFILHDWDDLGGDILLQKIDAAARADSLLVIGEFLLNDDRTGPLFVARQDLNMLVAARGRERTAGEYDKWVRSCGFELANIYLTSTGKHFMVAKRTARKRAVLDFAA